ncbi:hypothetical protein MBTS_09355 [Methylobacterium bullatum]|nr:hypothetical protein [Methylobacterium bullatum]
MGGAGVEARMAILADTVERNILDLLRSQGWTGRIAENNLYAEYIVVEAQKGDLTKKVALLYSASTDAGHLRALAETVDAVHTNEHSFGVRRYDLATGRSMTSVNDFGTTLVGWNKQMAPQVQGRPIRRRPTKQRRLVAEDPYAAVWTRLEQFSSVNVASKLIAQRIREAGKEPVADTVTAKAEGLAFSVRNAVDYLRSTPQESLTKRIISAYYGCMSLASAEMLAAPAGPASLDDLESFTKNGHGLFTLNTTPGDFGALGVGVLASGFFMHYANFLGADTSTFPGDRAKSPEQVAARPLRTFCTLGDLLAAVPEVGDLVASATGAKLRWVAPIPAPRTQMSGFSAMNVQGSSYLWLLDRSGQITPEDIVQEGWPIAELARVDASDPEFVRTGLGRGGGIYRCRVDHPDASYYSDVVPIHRSAFMDGTALILPPLLGLNTYRSLAFVTLYALSIAARYMPNTWRRVEGGDQDHNLAVVKTLLSVYERHLPQEFLEEIIDERISAVQPGSLY